MQGKRRWLKSRLPPEIKLGPDKQNVISLPPLGSNPQEAEFQQVPPRQFRSPGPTKN